MTIQQLNHIKKLQQNENTYTIPTVCMRAGINDTIIEELDTIYNPNLGGTETVFKQSLNDVALERDFLENKDLIDLIRNHGSAVLLIYIYLHTKMCAVGYKIEWDDIAIDIVAATLTSVYRIETAEIKSIIDEMIKRKLLYIISDNENQYLTSAYQVFMYERVAAKRLRDRIAKRNKNLKREEKLIIQTKLPSDESLEKEETPETQTQFPSAENLEIDREYEWQIPAEMQDDFVGYYDEDDNENLDEYYAMMIKEQDCDSNMPF